MKDMEFAKKYISNLEEEIKRLRRENINTIKIKIEYKGANYEVDTQIPKEFIEGRDYYLPNDYKEPTRVKLIDYNVGLSVNNKYYVYACVYNYETKELEDRDFKNLCKTKDKASKKYLESKEV